MYRTVGYLYRTIDSAPGPIYPIYIYSYWTNQCMWKCTSLEYQLKQSIQQERTLHF